MKLRTEIEKLKGSLVKNLVTVKAEMEAMKEQLNDLQLNKNKTDKALKETEKACDKKINGLVDVKSDEL